MIFLEPVRSHCLSSYFRILITYTAARESRGGVALPPKMEVEVLSAVMQSFSPAQQDGGIRLISNLAN